MGKNLLQQLQRNTAAIGMENRVADAVAGDVIAYQIIGAAMADDGVLRRISGMRSGPRQSDKK